MRQGMSEGQPQTSALRRRATTSTTRNGAVKRSDKLREILGIESGNETGGRLKAPGALGRRPA